MTTTTRTTPRPLIRFAAALLLLGSAACDSTPELEVRTFALEHLQPHEAQPIVEPYIFGERPDAPGMASVAEGVLTVRETTDNLDRIAQVLEEYDRARPDVQLHFQLIEADGFTDVDPRISAVETELRKIFQFAGYRLAGEAFVTATDRSNVAQQLRSDDQSYEIRGTVYRLRDGAVRLDGMELVSADSFLQTTVNIRMGQTLVLGSSPKAGSPATLLLTVRAEETPTQGEE